MKELTLREIRFCKEFLKDLSIDDAAAAANIRISTAKRWMKQDHIKGGIHQEFLRREERTDITRDKVLKEFAKLAFSNMQDYVTTGRGMVSIHPIQELPPEKAAAIAEVAETRDGIKFKLHDKKGALDSVARHLGMFNDKLEISAKRPLVIIGDDADYLDEEDVDE